MEGREARRGTRKQVLKNAAVKRIIEELEDPYEGIMYEKGKPRNYKWARIRVNDLPFVAEALRLKCPPGKCMCTDVVLGNVFIIYRCIQCGAEEWL